MFGYSLNEVNYGQLPIVLSEDEASFRQRLQDAANGQLAFGIEQRAQTRDGKTIDVSVWNATLRDESGRSKPSWKRSRTRQSASDLKSSFGRRRRWRRSDALPAESHTISITC